ncbi:hypothetical protein ACQR0V_28310 [Bradyrhizobium sp. HKCCYLS2058]|uniref:hypothetical protein n=1 Tax=unclassified Bradyrhizobium TaxID=2631580 RepID=UPI003EBF3B9F
MKGFSKVKTEQTKKPYDQRTDLEKINSQWHKLSGFHTREEWSAAVVRAATAAEIAANFALRQEFEVRFRLKPAVVNILLKNANGLNGKMNQLLIPVLKTDAPNYELSVRERRTLTKAEQKLAELKRLNKIAGEINDDRNGVVHQGQFRGEEQARKTIDNARKFIEGLVSLYEKNFKLKGEKREEADE